MELPFATLDVFTTRRFHGNQLAVVSVPGLLRDKLSPDRMQNIAREFNLSETVFLHDDEDDYDQDDEFAGGTAAAAAATMQEEITALSRPKPPPQSNNGGSRGGKGRIIDIFTTDGEVPFAGHPTIGTAVLLRHFKDQARKREQRGEKEDQGEEDDEDVETLITKAGPIQLSYSPLLSSPSTSSSSCYVRARIPLNTHLHKQTLGDVLSLPTASSSAPTSSSSSNSNDEERKQQQEQLQKYLPRDHMIQAAELQAPVFSIVNGMTFLLIRLPSVAALAEVRSPGLDVQKLQDDGPAGKEGLLDMGWRNSFVARYYYCEEEEEEENEGAATTPDKPVRRLRTRMMEMGFEDPATGSAASALAAYLALTEEHGGEEEEGGVTTTTKFEMRQGVEMGRESVIGVETRTKLDDNGEVVLDEVWLGGTAVVVMKGSLTIDDEPHEAVST